MSKPEQKDPETPAPETAIATSKTEVIRFTMFTTIFLFIVMQQMRIPTRFQSNQSIKDFFLNNGVDIFSKPYVGRVDSMNWIDQKLYPAYNLHRPDLNPNNSEVFPITYLRIRQKMVIIDPDTNLWTASLQAETKPKGIYYQYPYDQKTSSYVVTFQPYSTYSQNSTLMSSELAISFNNLRLIEMQYLNKQTTNVLADVSYYNGNTGFITTVLVTFIYTPQGMVLQSITFTSFVINAYATDFDKIRFVFEIIFIIFYVQYVLMEFVKIGSQIKRAIKEDEKLEAQQNERRLRKENKEAKRKMSGSPNKIMEKRSDTEKSAKDDLIEQAQKFRKKIKLVLKGVQRHVSDTWSALDVVQLIIIGLAMSDWIGSNANTDFDRLVGVLYGQVNNYAQLFSDPKLSENLDASNDIILNQGVVRKRYRILISIAALIMCIKMNKYYLHFLSAMNTYLVIIMNVVQYLISFFILILAMIFAFTEFLYFKFGNSISEFATFYNSFNYVYGMFIGVNDKVQPMFDIDATYTFILQLIFYLLMICIMVGLFYVFVVYEFNEYQRQLQEATKKEVQAKSAQHKSQDAVKYKHPIWYVYNVVELVVLNFWFTITFRRNHLQQYILHKENDERVLEREFKVNPQLIPFSIDFKDIIEGTSVDHDDSEEGSSLIGKRFLMEEERHKIKERQKFELVKLIWRTFVLLLLLILNFVLVQQFYSPNEAFLQQNSILSKILYGGQLNGQKQLFKSIKTLDQLNSWTKNIFPQLFDQIVLGKREVQSLYMQPESFKPKSGLSKDEDLQAYLIDDFSFENLVRGNSINFFNIVVNNAVRLSIRKSKIIENPNQQFRAIKPSSKLLFLGNPKDLSGSSNEFTDPFILKNGNITLLDVDYNKNGGWAASGGYDLIVEVEQVDSTISTLVQYGFLDYSVSSLTIEFVTFNPVNKRGLAYIVIYFCLNEGGMLDTIGVEVTAIKKNSLQTPQEISVLVLCLSLFFALCYYFYRIVIMIYRKGIAYERWYSTFILQMMSRAQIHFRHQHMPEVMRKWMYLLDVSQVLNFLFLILMGCQISFIIIAFFQTNSLIKGCNIFGVPIENILDSVLLALNPPATLNDFYSLTYDLTWSSYLIALFASLAILVLCLEILYLLANNRDYQNLTRSLLFSMTHLPYIMIILTGFVFSFVIMSYLIMGNRNRDYSTFFGALVQLTDLIINLSDIKTFRGIDNATEFLIMVVPFVLVIRFILVNIFYAIVYRAYLVTKQSADKQNQQDQSSHQESSTLTIGEFFKLSIQLFKFKEALPKPQSDLYLLQIIKQFDSKRIYSQIKENIRNEINLCNIKTWSEKCATDVKEEAEMREPIEIASKEILNAYIQLNNQGDFQILDRLVQDQERMMIEYGLKMLYIQYFQQSVMQLEKFVTFFNHRIYHLKGTLFAHIDAEKEIQQKDSEKQEQFQLVLISEYESLLQENLSSIQFIRSELEILGYNLEPKIEEEEEAKQMIPTPLEGANRPSKFSKQLAQSILKTPNQNSLVKKRAKILGPIFDEIDSARVNVNGVLLNFKSEDGKV